LGKSIVIFVVGCMAFVLLIAGCGGGGGSDSADAQQIDKATFVKRANRICQEASGKLSAELVSITAREEAKPNYDYAKAQVAFVKQALIPFLEEELEEFRALGIPSEAKKDVEAFLAASQKAIDKSKANPKAIAEGNPALLAAEVPGTKFGVTECPIAPVDAG
jgi:hypothetical protein